MKYMYRSNLDSDKNEVFLNILILILGVIIFANIGLKMWQVSLEEKFNVSYQEAKTSLDGYRNKYYFMDDAIEGFLVDLDLIKENAKSIMTNSFITAIVEGILLAVTLLPIMLMYEVFSLNRMDALYCPSKTTHIILGIETVIAILTCVVDILGACEIVGQYQQIFDLIQDVFGDIGSLLDTIDYQMNQY